MNKLKISLPSNTKFGYFFTLTFFLIFIYLIIDGLYLRGLIFLILSFIFLLITLLRPSRLLLLNKIWIKFGIYIGIVVSPIVLGVIFFGIFTPVSILMKFIQRDELLITMSNNNTYWKHKTDQKSSSSSFKNQF